jgi:hypothetical protein
LSFDVRWLRALVKSRVELVTNTLSSTLTNVYFEDVCEDAVFVLPFLPFSSSTLLLTNPLGSTNHNT